MSRPRTPTNVLKLRGAAKNHPERLRERENEPEPTAGIGPASKHLTEAEAEIWDELVDIIPPGVLGDTDRIALERMCRLLRMARFDPGNWTSAREKDLIQYLGRFGMTPSDRSKISVPKGKSKNPWEDL